MQGHGHAHGHDRQPEARQQRPAAPYAFGRLDAPRAIETTLAAGEHSERGVSVLA
jgi:hypothetical protein